MPLRRRRSHYQQLTRTIERDCVIGLHDVRDFLSTILQKDLARMYPLCMIVGCNGQEMVLLQEDRIPGSHVAQLRR
ncbi:uncharacterized protein TNCV_924291 [Trichonephila clavipes]|nr:uncharacterized protein TNCV_924291 [Trichonephila clavipes]